ncbi:hypothetical protein K440DRAFT_63242 [Wilcoxina mikolae CBS 423.85]|nr:hypothetical protein K440DRAFT_63242 [Wilcoxina mikolae CBS 423.85]
MAGWFSEKCSSLHHRILRICGRSNHQRSQTPIRPTETPMATPSRARPASQSAAYIRYRSVEEWKINPEEGTWELVEEIGGGGSSIVFTGRYSDYPELVAVKRIAKRARTLGALEKEVSFMKEVQNFAMMSQV